MWQHALVANKYTHKVNKYLRKIFTNCSKKFSILNWKEQKATDLIYFQSTIQEEMMCLKSICQFSISNCHWKRCHRSSDSLFSFSVWSNNAIFFELKLKKNISIYWRQIEGKEMEKMSVRRLESRSSAQIFLLFLLSLSFINLIIMELLKFSDAGEEN